MSKDESYDLSSHSDEERLDVIDYDDTIKAWRDKSARLAFIYDYVLDKYKKRVDMFTLIAFLLTSVTSLVAFGNLGLDESNYPDIALVLKITSAILTTCAATSTGIIRVFGRSEERRVGKCRSRWSPYH